MSAGCGGRPPGGGAANSSSPARPGVILFAHGAPEGLEDAPEFLEHILEAPAPPALLAEVRARYAAIGGASPLNAVSRRQAEALARRLSLPVFLAFRYAHPSLAEALSKARAAGCDRLVAVYAAPQFSCPPPLLIPSAPSVHHHPLFIEAIAEKVAPLAQGREVLFTAHSLPGRAAAPDYDREARATGAAIAARCELPAFDFAYQGQGRPAGEWLGPTVESRLEALAARGVRDLVLVPLSFTADNLEVLYDIDIHFRQYALERGLCLVRTETPGDSPLFIDALAATAAPWIEAAP